MVNWQIFKVTGGSTWESEEHKKNSTYGGVRNIESVYDDIKDFYLDKHVEFANGYAKSIKVKGCWKSYYHRCGGYAEAERARNKEYKFIEIDLDRTKFKDKNHYFENSVIRIIPEEEATRRNVLAAASANPTALAVAREAMDKVSRGELSELEYKIVDNSGNLHHHFIYRK